jgi:hypothetical protein
MQIEQPGDDGNERENAFTMDQYADAWPEAGEKAAALLFAASGSKTVATAGEGS